MIKKLNISFQNQEKNIEKLCLKTSSFKIKRVKLKHHPVWKIVTPRETINGYQKTKDFIVK